MTEVPESAPRRRVAVVVDDEKVIAISRDRFEQFRVRRSCLL
jgi:hypothetical protein